MSNIETKTVDFKVKGKNGFVNTCTIQRHKPSAPMCFIRTVSGHMLFCQENHPVCIKLIDGQDTVVEAKDVVMFHDRIWVDNTDVVESTTEKTNILIKDSDDYQSFIDKFITIVNGYEVKNILNENKYFIGDSVYNFYINPVVLKDLCDIDQYVLFTQLTKIYSTQYSTPQDVRIFSFNLVSQLKSIADKIGINCIFDINLSMDNEVFWSLNKFDKDNKDTLITEYVDIEQVISGIDGYQGYVYDLKTDTEEFMNNNVQTHNSFHTGGAAEFKKINILKELKSSVPVENESFVERSFEQKENDLYSNVDILKIVVNKTLYKDEYKIKREGDAYKLALGYFTMIVGENEIRSTIEMPVDLFITHDFSENENEIVVIYGKGDKIFNIKYFKIAPEEVAQKIDKLVAGKSPWETPEDLLKKLHDNLSQFGPYDMTHIEVILSNILRNKTDPMIPARLKEPYDPVTFSIKTLPSVLSWSLGIAFENFSKALTYGLISKDPGNLSSIEKVLYGEPLSDLSKELLKKGK
jgi:hypothetical protein